MRAASTVEQPDGHAPDIIRVCGLPNVLPSSTNPPRPFTVNTIPELCEVRADGQLLSCEPASVLPLAQRSFLFRSLPLGRSV